MIFCISVWGFHSGLHEGPLSPTPHLLRKQNTELAPLLPSLVQYRLLVLLAVGCHWYLDQSESWRRGEQSSETERGRWIGVKDFYDDMKVANHRVWAQHASLLWASAVTTKDIQFYIKLFHKFVSMETEEETTNSRLTLAIQAWWKRHLCLCLFTGRGTFSTEFFSWACLCANGPACFVLYTYMDMSGFHKKEKKILSICTA